MIALRPLRLLLGLALWIGLAVWIFTLLSFERDGRSVARDLGDFATRESFTFELGFARKQVLAVGDFVYPARPRDHVGPDLPREDPIGEVEALLTPAGEIWSQDSIAFCRRARLRIYDRRRADPRADARVRLLVVPDFAAQWVLETLVPPEVMKRIVATWRASWLREGPGILRVSRRAIDAILKDLEITVSQETQGFIRRHRRDLARILDRVEGRLDREVLARLFETTAWPLAEKHFRPVLDRIGARIWDRFPVWGLSWRWAFEALPFTRDDFFEQRWNRFIDREVIPILKRHTPRFVDAARTMARETLADERVAATLNSLLLTLLSDAEFQELVKTYTREVFIDNPRFRARVEARWKSAPVRRAVDYIANRLDDTVRAMTDLVIGTEETGLSPRFARVLRSQVLKKGRRQLELDLGRAAEPLRAGQVVEASIEDQPPGAQRG